MQPTYFPFTSIGKKSADWLTSFFDTTIIYQPRKGMLSQAKGFEIRTPVSDQVQELETALQAYHNSSHQGPPLHHPESVRTIRSEIQQQKPRQPQGPDTLLMARLFLCLAHEFDQSQHEIQNNIQNLNNLEQKMMDALHGSDYTQKFPQQPLNDIGAYMTAERMQAWTYIQKNDPDASGLYLTDSPAVFDFVLERTPGTDLVLKDQSQYLGCKIPGIILYKSPHHVFGLFKLKGD